MMQEEFGPECALVQNTLEADLSATGDLGQISEVYQPRGHEWNQHEGQTTHS